MRTQSSFLVKRESGRIQFSSEKYNLTSQNAFKYQGIANDKAVDISQVRTASPSSLPLRALQGDMMRTDKTCSAAVLRGRQGQEERHRHLPVHQVCQGHVLPGQYSSPFTHTLSLSFSLSVCVCVWCRHGCGCPLWSGLAALAIEKRELSAMRHVVAVQTWTRERIAVKRRGFTCSQAATGNCFEGVRCGWCARVLSLAGVFSGWAKQNLWQTFKW